MRHRLHWKRWNDEIVKQTHGDVDYFRALYDGDHQDLFPRAKHLKNDGEVTSVLEHGFVKGKKIQPPYLIANVSKLVCDIPAMLVSRAVGKPYMVNKQDISVEADDLDESELEAGEDETETITNDKIVEGIYDRSRLAFEHWANIAQLQTDGGIVGVVINDAGGVRIDTKSRDMAFPHPDGNGWDLAYKLDIVEEEDEDNPDEDETTPFLHIHREYVDNGTLYTEEILYRIGESTDLEEIEDDYEKARLLEMDADDLYMSYENRSRTFITYLANEKTFREPLGRSALRNQAPKQEEINWTLTRNAIVYQRNGKPRLAVSKETFTELQQKAYERWGDESKIDSDDLEITTLDDSGNPLQVIQVDTTKIGDISWVKDLMKMLFIETRTSEKAVDFYLDDTGAPAQSGVAKFYDLFVSIMKAEQLAKEYTAFLGEMFENALYILQEEYPELNVAKPAFEMNDMIPVPRKERMETEKSAYEGGDGIQSLYQSIKKANPTWTEEQIEEEQTRVEEGRQSQNSASLAGNPTDVQNFLDNRGSGLVDPNNQDEE